MNVKKIVIIVIILAVLVGVGFFLFISQMEKKKKKKVVRPEVKKVTFVFAKKTIPAHAMIKKSDVTTKRLLPKSLPDSALKKTKDAGYVLDCSYSEYIEFIRYLEKISNELKNR